MSARDRDPSALMHAAEKSPRTLWHKNFNAPPPIVPRGAARQRMLELRSSWQTNKRGQRADVRGQNKAEWLMRVV